MLGITAMAEAAGGGEQHNDEGASSSRAVHGSDRKEIATSITGTCTPVTSGMSGSATVSPPPRRFPMLRDNRTGGSSPYRKLMVRRRGAAATRPGNPAPWPTLGASLLRSAILLTCPPLSQGFAFGRRSESGL